MTTNARKRFNRPMEPGYTGPGYTRAVGRAADVFVDCVTVDCVTVDGVAIDRDAVDRAAAAALWDEPSVACGIGCDRSEQRAVRLKVW